MAGPLDRETVPEYQVIVIARDNAISGNQLEVGCIITFFSIVSLILFILTMQSIATVRVVITDVNDNAPQFGSNLYTAWFREDIASGVEVQTVSLT